MFNNSYPQQSIFSTNFVCCYVKFCSLLVQRKINVLPFLHPFIHPFIMCVLIDPQLWRLFRCDLWSSFLLFPPCPNEKPNQQNITINHCHAGQEPLIFFLLFPRQNRKFVLQINQRSITSRHDFIIIKRKFICNVRRHKSNVFENEIERKMNRSPINSFSRSNEK